MPPPEYQIKLIRNLEDIADKLPEDNKPEEFSIFEAVKQMTRDLPDYLLLNSSEIERALQKDLASYLKFSTEDCKIDFFGYSLKNPFNAIPIEDAIWCCKFPKVAFYRYWVLTHKKTGLERPGWFSDIGLVIPNGDWFSCEILRIDNKSADSLKKALRSMLLKCRPDGTPEAVTYENAAAQSLAGEAAAPRPGRPEALPSYVPAIQRAIREELAKPEGERRWCAVDERLSGLIPVSAKRAGALRCDYLRPFTEQYGALDANKVPDLSTAEGARWDALRRLLGYPPRD